ncbi:bifunctional 2-dehydro-3-deoxygluconokinase/2-dehydro-3-deoxygalactonokinase (plasmid) [Haloferacaceae archaeon DSL9]
MSSRDAQASTTTRSAELVTFGETMTRLSAPPGERLEVSQQLEFRTAGAESNVAVAAARLGTDATWLSKLPSSPLGRRVVSDVRSHGVEPRVVWSDTHRQGAYYLERGGDPRGVSVIYDRADSAATTATVTELDTDCVRDANVFFTTGITPALSGTLRETTESLLEVASEGGTTAAFDLNYRSKLWPPEEAKAVYEALFPRIDILFAPERDARQILGLEGDATAILESLAPNFETVVLTRGAEGAIAASGTERFVQPAIETETVDPIGTGDAFVGAYLARHLSGGSPDAALRYGAAAAALKRTMEGDLAVVTPEEVSAIAADASGGISR